NAWREVVAVDFTPRSLEMAQAFAAHQGAKITFQRSDLMDAATIPEGPFDAILSLGVLHYLEDPVVGLKNLVARLAPDGVLLLYYYGKEGRLQLEQQRALLSLLVPDAKDVEQKIAAANDLGVV